MLFCGSGSTYAIDKLIGVMGLRVPSNLDDRWHVTDAIPPNQRPVVFIGPFEHHSNELTWRESIADVVVIRESADGHVDLDQLAEELVRYADRPVKIGSFSAASNVTGIITDSRAVSAVLHEHGALAFWDFAASAPYVDIDMGPVDAPSSYDAVFISTHKLIGGPGTPGVLVAKRSLFTNRVPVVVGGGTVEYVNSDGHDFHADIAHREEGGTPAIVESIRAGLVFQLKAAVGVDEIRRREEDFVTRAIRAWDATPGVEILGSHDAERLSIVSFVIRYQEDGADDSESGRKHHLHHNFVVALLNDLFGIQARGGCSCAGPYGHRLLGIDDETLAGDRARRHRQRVRGHQARLGAGQLQLLHRRGDLRLHHRGRAPRGERGCRAAAELHLRAGDRAVASPRRRPADAADVAARGRLLGRRDGLSRPSEPSPRPRSRQLPHRGAG